ncbi:transmembrane protein, putative, partial [Rhizoctonia solani AG-3 Rhs1AP]
MTGGIALQNLSDELTFGKLVELVGGGAKLIDVPIMGDEDLASMRLDHAQLEVVRSDSKLSVSGLEIALSWGAKDIGQMKTFGNRLSIGMYEGSSEIPFTSMAGPGTSDLGKTCANLECSTIKTDGDPERVVVLSGSIINPLGAVDPAGLIDTWAGSSSPGLNSLWEQALPGNVNKSFQLQECTHNPLTSDPKWGFAFALDVRNFRFADLVSDHQLATRIDQVFHINQVSVLAFSNPGNMGLSRIYELLRNVSVSRLLPSESSFLPNDLDETTFDQRITKIQTGDASSNEKPDVVHKAGLAILARFSFSSAKPGSLADNLNAVAQSKLPDVDLMGYFGKITQAQPADGQPAKDQSVETLELGTLFKLSNIILRIEYNFGSTSDTPSGDKVDKPDDGALPSPTAKPSRLSLTDLSLNGRLTLGSLEADVFVVFESLQPGALMFTAPQEWSISDVFNKIFGGNFPNTLLDIKFSNFIMYYAWKDLKKPSESKDIKLRAESFKKGFHAESDVNLFGIPFSLSIHIHREDKDTQGIEIAGETAPVNVLGLTLHGAKDINKGPEFKFYTAPIKKCSMLTGVALFKQDLGTIDVEYKSDKSRFLGTVGLPESVPILSGVKVNFELAKKGGKNVLRIVGIPAAFKDLLNIDEIFQKVRDLNQDTCGVFVNNLKEFVKTTFHVNLEVPEDHKGLSPETGDEGASELRLYLNPSVEVKIATHSVDTIVFGQIEISVPVPKEFTLDAFANSFWKVLNESVPRILDALLDPRWDNVEKLAKVLTIVAAEKAIADAARKLMCRNNNNEPEDPEDPSQPEEQKPVKETGGGGGLGGLLWIIGGIAAVIIGTGIVLGILGTIYYWLQSRERDEPPNKPADAPPEPPRREDPISKLLRAAVEPEDKFTRWKHCESFSHALEAARDCALNYYTAIRIYEQILGPNGVPTKLGNKAYKFYCHKLEELKYELFTMDTQFGEKWLEIHDGIALTPHPTLDGLMLDVSWTAPGSEDLVGAVVTVTTNGVEQNPTKVVEAKQRMDLVQVPFSEAKSTVTVQVKAFCAIQGNKSDDWGIGDESDYAFFSFGKPVNVTIEIEKIDVPGGRPIYLTRLDADTRPRHQPPFTEVDYFGPLVGQKQHPVLVTGSLTWWPIRYGSSPNELTLLGYDATLRFRRDLILSDVPPGSIKKIRIAIEQMCVEVYDTNENKLATFGLSLFPMAREAD